MRLETDRLLIRNLRKNDAGRLTEICSGDKDYYGFTRIPYPYKRKHADEFLTKVKSDFRKNKSAHLAVVLKDKNQAIGSVSLNSINWEDGNATMGYMIDKKFQSQS